MELQLWLMKHLCEKCGGTLTPIDGYVAATDATEGQADGGAAAAAAADSSEKAVHECNSCGTRRPDRVFDMIVQAEMAAAGMDDDSDDDDDDDDDDEGDDGGGEGMAEQEDSGQEYDDVD
jgi:hypothetical protein